MKDAIDCSLLHCTSCPFSLASCAGVCPVTSLALRRSLAPPWIRSMQASPWPRMAAQCSGVHPSRSGTSTRPLANNKRRRASVYPLYAAQCSALEGKRARANTGQSKEEFEVENFEKFLRGTEISGDNFLWGGLPAAIDVQGVDVGLPPDHHVVEKRNLAVLRCDVDGGVAAIVGNVQRSSGPKDRVCVFLRRESLVENISDVLRQCTDSINLSVYVFTP